MPVMNGLEATRKIKATSPNLPVIALTAYISEHDKNLALHSGCDDFITKPINKKVFFDSISKYLKRNIITDVNI